MRIKVRTPVSAKIANIKSGFTKELFLALNPPFPPVKLLRFDGCKKGDWVNLELNFILFKQQWVSEIIEDGEDEKQWFFIDQGVNLPFFLKNWTHRHIVANQKSEVVIIDDINYTTGTLLTDLIFYPILYLQFLYRKPIYRAHFS